MLESRFNDEIYIDIEMNSLEDCYMNIAKEEMKLMRNQNNIEEIYEEGPNPIGTLREPGMND